MSDAKRLLIKQVTGTLLLDSAAAGTPFVLGREGADWQVRVEQVSSELWTRLAPLSDDLNLFYFEEESGPRPEVRKWWLYGRKPPRLAYDADARTLTVLLDTRVYYSNDDVMQTREE
ncbi:hypothetical protein IDH44_06965 [Paenibacillus sp. IB182496]|uniref:Uncharacterized protein n=1 Tax=Paenibacillus sabuli TaxID=2772509 RepID=A0A927BSW1_9BACL|nr:hypothetical protein [Paenibacillus sabuli]MBD2844924.1 hypothetical protein [Paenibacillus sabuli]